MLTHRAAGLIAALIAAAATRAALPAEDRPVVVSIQVRDGAELRTLGTFGTDVRLTLAGVGPRAEEGEYEEYPYREASLGWDVAKTGRGYTIRVAFGTERLGWYLSYDPGAPAKGVFLAEEATAGSYWDLDRFPAETPNEATPIRAKALGRDWQLDYDPAPRKYLRGKPVGNVATLYRPRLTKGRGAWFLMGFYGK